MLDHVILTVSDFHRSVVFYTKVLKPLGITMSMDFKGEGGHPDLKGFGDGSSIFFWLKEGKANSNGIHVGFVAKDHAAVDACHKAAVAAGAKTMHAPRVFPEYYSGYYAAWIIDPDGYEIELVNKS
jgi:catechol 2,3-dioxygenase-like lactoylglutathione lyase family enzyme